MSVKMMTTSLLVRPSQRYPLLNKTTSNTTHSDSNLAISCFTMIFGTISNLIALGILAKSRVKFCRQSKAPFLLLTVALLLADLGGHTVLGSFALYIHIVSRHEAQALQSRTTFCDIFGTNMVFFGLCPLLLGCAMAAERCVAITKPFFSVSVITVAHMFRVVLLLSCLALVLAVLPLVTVGTYTVQYPHTWCFLKIYGPFSAADIHLALAFSCLGLTALTLSLIFNFISVAALLQARMKSQDVKTNSTGSGARRVSCASSSLFFTLDVEVMVQLTVITVVSCVCWSPFLLHILVTQLNRSSSSSEPSEHWFSLLGLRMAAWNQILDPWVYILLRRTVFFRVYRHRGPQ